MSNAVTARDRSREPKQPSRLLKKKNTATRTHPGDQRSPACQLLTAPGGPALPIVDDPYGLQKSHLATDSVVRRLELQMGLISSGVTANNLTGQQKQYCG